MKANPILFILSIICLFSCQEKMGEYVCQPCDLSCDTLTFTQAGTCPHCQMKLIKKSELIEESALAINEIDISTGSGVFLMEGGQGHEEQTIKVYYHRPENYTKDSKVLIVIPGAGRNGDSYRDAWIEESEKYSVLILSPMYPEADYAFEDYHLCGLVQDVNLKASVEFVENTNIAKLDEDAFSYKVNSNRNEWIFGDFDRIFDAAVAATGSTQTQYDLFGHSAGGQILHRFAIFHPDSKAHRIIAGNSGFYTLPDFDTPLPFGIQNTPLNPNDLQLSFSKKLTLLIGELDNADETGGTLLRSPTADKQGLHRLARGQFFHASSKQFANEMEVDYNWEIIVVPNVGHDHRKMGDVAGGFLYGE